jgi:hypothetical protein
MNRVSVQRFIAIDACCRQKWEMGMVRRYLSFLK